MEQDVKKRMREECQKMQEFLEIETSDDANELVERLARLNVYMARSAKMLADAKRLQDEATEKCMRAMYQEIGSMPATIAAKIITSCCKDANYLVNWLDRINKACVHQSDNIRTQVSYSKEQLKLTRNGY